MYAAAEILWKLKTEHWLTKAEEKTKGYLNQQYIPLEREEHSAHAEDGQVEQPAHRQAHASGMNGAQADSVQSMY